mgnify:CR=1 FL=1
MRAFLTAYARSTAALGSVLLLASPFVLSPSQTTTLTTTVVYAIVGMSLLVLTGWAGQVSLGQFGLSAIGAYVAAVSGLPFLLALLVGALALTTSLAGAEAGAPISAVSSAAKLASTVFRATRERSSWSSAS